MCEAIMCETIMCEAIMCDYNKRITGPLVDAAHGLADVLGPTHEGQLELGLVDVVQVVSRRQHLALVNKIRADCPVGVRIQPHQATPSIDPSVNT